MITPQQYENWPLQLEELSQELEDYVLEDIIRRLFKEGRITSTGYIQMQALVEYSGLSYDEIRRKITEMSGLLSDEVDALYGATIAQLQDDYGPLYEALGVPSTLTNREFVQGLLNATSQQTKGTFGHITNSLGFNFKLSGRTEWIPLENIYHKTLDFVTMQVQSGGATIDTAVKQAIAKLTNSGLKTIDYASGHIDHVDVAVRRAAVTGMHQISGALSEMAVNELGTNLVEVSAHQGARDKGDVPKNHKLWQGKVYYWKEKGGEPPKESYQDFIYTTGYGTGPGLKGWNCRHDYGPFVEGVSERVWTDEALANIDKPDLEYEGKKYTAFEATQRQRELERAIRAQKRRLLGLEAAGVNRTDPAYTTTALKLRMLQAKYNEFSAAAGLRTQLERARVQGYGRSQAATVRNIA